MKKIILFLFIAATLFSCQEEYSFEGGKEDIYKKRSTPKLNLVSAGDGINNNGENREVTVQHAPFDFGISAVLGVGALAAVRTARKRRKETAGIKSKE